MNIQVRVGFTALWCLLGLVAGTLAWLVLVSGASDDQAARRPVPASVSQWKPPPGELLDPQESIDDQGFGLAGQFTAPIHDPASLQELRAAIRVRGRLAMAVLEAESDQVRLGFRPPREDVAAAARLRHQIGLLNLYEGRYPEAAACFKEALPFGSPRDIPERERAQRMALLGVIALRGGDRENDRQFPGSTSRIFPIAPPAVLLRQAGAREAVKRFTECLKIWPDDLRARWLLNLAYMTLGEYPDQVPSPYVIPLDRFRSTVNVGWFENVAPGVGLTARGPNLAGGSLFDDFNGDGRPDVFACSLDVERGASLFVNRGDEWFDDRSAGAGLAEQVYAVNAAHADFDNDGDLDVLLLRGAEELPLRLSLLRNWGYGAFEDVTVAAGLGDPIATGSAAWGDYDNDGRVNLFVCGEYRSRPGDASSSPPDPRNRCRLYHNRGDGRFVNVAAAAGVTNDRCAKGAAWEDYDGDGHLDLYVSNQDGPGRLYHNQGDGTFLDVAPSLGVTGPDAGFACWFWDFNNDGRPDLYVNGSPASLADIAADALGRPFEKAGRPWLYSNRGAEGFQEVARAVGLDRPMAAMGCNFGDIDNDGYLDIYLGNGWRSFSSLVPNRMFKNVAGRQFEDVTISSGTGSLRTGNGVSFADYDGDGDLDLFVQTGGAVPGDPSDNLLFRNPGHGRRWLEVKLVGTRTNRAAIGARIRVNLTAADGTARSIYRTIGNNSSYGGNRLVELIGLGDASRAAAITVSWPASRTTQIFRDIAADQRIEITEGAGSYRSGQ